MRKGMQKLVVGGLLLASMLPALPAGAAQALICFSKPYEKEILNVGAAQGVADALKRHSATLQVDYYMPDKDKQSLEEVLKAKRYDVVVGVGESYVAPFKAAASRHPRVRYAVMDSEYAGTEQNVRTVSFAKREAGYLAGLVAASNSKTNRVGFVGTAKSSQAEQEFLQGYQAGIATIKPHTELYVGYAPKAQEQATAKLVRKLCKRNADVIFTTPEVSAEEALQVAQEEKKLVVTCHSQKQWRPTSQEKKALAGSVVLRNDLAVYSTLASVLEQEWHKGPFVYNYENEGLGYVLNTAALPDAAATKANVADYEAKLYLKSDEIDYSLHCAKVKKIS